MKRRQSGPRYERETTRFRVLKGDNQVQGVKGRKPDSGCKRETTRSKV